VPGRTGVDLKPETVGELASHKGNLGEGGGSVIVVFLVRRAKPKFWLIVLMMMVVEDGAEHRDDEDGDDVGASDTGSLSWASV
jgi:hypothetical protein